MQGVLVCLGAYFSLVLWEVVEYVEQVWDMHYCAAGLIFGCVERVVV